MKAVTHLEKVIAGEASAVTHLEKVIVQETTAVTYTEKVIAGEASPITHLQKVIAGVARPVTHLEYVWAGGSPPSVQEYTGAVPVTFIADGTPLLDYLISGNTVQSGTPTPDNPVMPQGTGERTGNLFDEIYPNISGTIRYNAIFVGDGTFTLSTTIPYDLGVANVFLLSGNVSTGASTPRNGAFLNNKVTTQSVDGYVTIAYRHYTGTTSPANCQTMLNSGSTPLPYEPYGYKIPISSAGTTTPIYLGEVQTTRKIKKYIFDGSEQWQRTTNGAYCLASSVTPITDFWHDLSITSVNSHFAAQENVTGSSSVSNNKSAFYGGSTLATKEYYIAARDIADATSFKSYLAQQYAAGTPVTIWYVLATEETGIVNEPLMRIGDYADTLSMEQAGAQIPTANGSTTLDVETTVKPSEVYIKYRGEAVATLSALSAEVSSPEETTEEGNPEEMEEEENGSEDVSLQHKPEAIE